MAWSMELEVLDQLLGGDLSLTTLRTLFPNDESFRKSMLGLLRGGDIRLVLDDVVVPTWQGRELFDDSEPAPQRAKLIVQLTQQGARRIA